MLRLFEGLGGLPRIGEILSVSAALVWAVSVILFRIAGDRLHPLAMNLFKNWLALGLLAATLAATGTAWPAAGPGTYAVFFLSGVLGIAVSDWLFLTALIKLGAELTAIVDCAYSPFVIGLSVLFLGERMSALQTFGVVLIVGAVLLITLKKSDERIARRDLLTGVAVGVVSMFLTASGIVLVKPFLAGVPVVWATTVRMAGGAVAALFLMGFHPRRRALLAPLRVLGHYRTLVPAAILSSYVSVLIWMGGMKYTEASIASALNQLNSIFVFLLAALVLKERITPLKLVAVVLAFAGAVLVSVPF
jgi:drug/metabolite transporter (DMT)-like permease